LFPAFSNRCANVDDFLPFHGNRSLNGPEIGQGSRGKRKPCWIAPPSGHDPAGLSLFSQAPKHGPTYGLGFNLTGLICQALRYGGCTGRVTAGPVKKSTGFLRPAVVFTVGSTFLIHIMIHGIRKFVSRHYLSRSVATNQPVDGVNIIRLQGKRCSIPDT
jgi:hypothetical protein